MAIYVLIHGGSHGGWCWDKVTVLLRKKGHLVEAPDLPGHGKDRTPIQEVTLKSCVNKICIVVAAQSKRVIAFVKCKTAIDCLLTYSQYTVKEMNSYGV